MADRSYPPFSVPLALPEKLKCQWDSCPNCKKQPAVLCGCGTDCF